MKLFETRLERGIGVAVVVMLLLQLAFWAGVIYVALHFIRKVW